MPSTGNMPLPKPLFFWHDFTSMGGGENGIEPLIPGECEIAATNTYNYNDDTLKHRHKNGNLISQNTWSKYIPES